MFHISQSQKKNSFAAVPLRVLKYSHTVTMGAASTLLLISLLGCVKADPLTRTKDWKMSFEDTFSSRFDTDKWINTFWWGDGHINDGSINYYSPNNVSVSSGTLILKVNNNRKGGKSYTGAIVQTYGKFYQKYGYFEARVKVPKGQGIGPYFSLSPQEKSWPPEINIFEIPGSRGVNATKVWMTNHYKDANGNHTTTNAQGTWTAKSGLDQNYHTYGVLWEPGLLVWYVDGFERYRTTVGVPDKDCYLVLGLGVGSDNGRWTGKPSKTTFPKYMFVDWVRAWKTN